MVVVTAVLAMAACFAVLPPIGQDPLYHNFSDGRTIYGVPNFWNVISNLPFLLVALYGVKALRSHMYCLRGRLWSAPARLTREIVRKV